MATGDIRNNLKMLSAEIRSVKTPSALVNLEGMMAGDPEVYLPVYDYLFQWYSTRLANEILRRDLKLPPYKHNKTKFLETMYLVLRELFQWKPPLSTSQFFSSGFAEKKIIMCRDIVKLIKEYSVSQKAAAATSPASTATRPRAQKVPAAKSSAAMSKAGLQPAAPPNSSVTRDKPPSSKAVLSAKIDTLLHHLMEVQSSVKALKEQMLLVMNQTETMLDQVLPVVTEIVDELYKKEAADVTAINSELRHDLDKGDSAVQEGTAASGVAEAITVRPKSAVLLD
uniref:Centrosomal protein of 44 kDa n=1 Tax=Rhipicephalus zambeziensis TaxID=60191 RepID=A0A224YJP6_9ACAR